MKDELTHLGFVVSLLCSERTRKLALTTKYRTPKLNLQNFVSRSHGEYQTHLLQIIKPNINDVNIVLVVQNMEKLRTELL